MSHTDDISALIRQAERDKAARDRKAAAAGALRDFMNDPSAPTTRVVQALQNRATARKNAPATDTDED